VTLKLIDVSHSGRRNLRQQTPQFVFSICQSSDRKILAVTHREIKCKEARLARVEEQIIELRFATPVETDNLAVEDGLARIRRSERRSKIFK
jgi:hypothetical protein